ncbi:hypothetical protein LXL04_028826 [Taraxacum kok-saghyz]
MRGREKSEMECGINEDVRKIWNDENLQDMIQILEVRCVGDLLEESVTIWNMDSIKVARRLSDDVFTKANNLGTGKIDTNYRPGIGRESFENELAKQENMTNCENSESTLPDLFTSANEEDSNDETVINCSPDYTVLSISKKSIKEVVKSETNLASSSTNQIEHTNKTTKTPLKKTKVFEKQPKKPVQPYVKPQKQLKHSNHEVIFRPPPPAIMDRVAGGGLTSPEIPEKQPENIHNIKNTIYGLTNERSKQENMTNCENSESTLPDLFTSANEEDSDDETVINCSPDYTVLSISKKSIKEVVKSETNLASSSTNQIEHTNKTTKTPLNKTKVFEKQPKKPVQPYVKPQKQVSKQKLKPFQKPFENRFQNITFNHSRNFQKPSHQKVPNHHLPGIGRESFENELAKQENMTNCENSESTLPDLFTSANEEDSDDETVINCSPDYTVLSISKKSIKEVVKSETNLASSSTNQIEHTNKTTKTPLNKTKVFEKQPKKPVQPYVKPQKQLKHSNHEVIFRPPPPAIMDRVAGGGLTSPEIPEKQPENIHNIKNTIYGLTNERCNYNNAFAGFRNLTTTLRIEIKQIKETYREREEATAGCGPLPVAGITGAEKKKAAGADYPRQQATQPEGGGNPRSSRRKSMEMWSELSESVAGRGSRSEVMQQGPTAGRKPSTARNSGGCSRRFSEQREEHVIAGRGSPEQQVVGMKELQPRRLGLLVKMKVTKVGCGCLQIPILIQLSIKYNQPPPSLLLITQSPQFSKPVNRRLNEQLNEQLNELVKTRKSPN